MYSSIFVMEFGRVTDLRFEQRPNAHSPRLVTLSGIVMDVRLEQLWKAQFPMLVTLSGIVMVVRPEQPAKVPLSDEKSPMLVTLSGRVMDVRVEHPKKADCPILVNSPEKVIVPTPSSKVWLVMTTLNAFV